jgi:L-fuculose-phosphate aldolase
LLNFESEIEKLKSEIVKFGKLIYQSGLTDSHGGNISVRFNDFILIKATGKMLCCLTKDDIVATTLEPNPELDKEASMELKVHRSIYNHLPEVKAVVHAHPPYTVAVSINAEKLEFLDSESKLILGNVPVLKAKKVIASDEVAEKIVEYLKTSKAVIIRSHGPFTVGKSLEEAFMYLSALENSCKIISIVRAMES